MESRLQTLTPPWLRHKHRLRHRTAVSRQLVYSAVRKFIGSSCNSNKSKQPLAVSGKFIRLS